MSEKKNGHPVGEPGIERERPVSVLIYFPEFKIAGNTSIILESGAVYLFRDYMTGLALAATKALLTLFSNDAKKHQGTIGSYPK